MMPNGELKLRALIFATALFFLVGCAERNFVPGSPLARAFGYNGNPKVRTTDSTVSSPKIVARLRGEAIAGKLLDATIYGRYVNQDVSFYEIYSRNGEYRGEISRRGENKTIVGRWELKNDLLCVLYYTNFSDQCMEIYFEDGVIQFVDPISGRIFAHTTKIEYKRFTKARTAPSPPVIATPSPRNTYSKPPAPSPQATVPTPRASDTVPQKPSAPDTTVIRRRIAIIQRQLASLGYDTGPADGVLGPKTRAAIRAFEAREGLPVTGAISKRMEAALRSATHTFASKTPPKPQPPKKSSTGSGFIVSAQGHVLTNEHVVEGCREVRVAGISNVGRVAIDNQIDLALLKVSPSERSHATFRGGRGVRTGEDIIVAGYPLHGLLSAELNVTKGTLSSLSGPGDDRRIIQITAPVQQGNSGGPVLDSSGNVVGVVRSKLNAIKFARATGVLPENINFAVSAGTARAFLDSHDVPYATARSDNPVPTADIAAKAKGYTVLIECWK